MHGQAGQDRLSADKIELVQEKVMRVLWSGKLCFLFAAATQALTPYSWFIRTPVDGASRCLRLSHRLSCPYLEIVIASKNRRRTNKSKIPDLNTRKPRLPNPHTSNLRACAPQIQTIIDS